MHSPIRTLLVLLLGCCLAAQAAAQVTVTTRGARSCAAWAENRLDEREGHPLKAQVHQTWLVGFLSGMAASSGVDFMARTRNEPLFLMVDRYCGENPGANLAQAGTVIAQELMAQTAQASVTYGGTQP